MLPIYSILSNLKNIYEIVYKISMSSQEFQKLSLRQVFQLLKMIKKDEPGLHEYAKMLFRLLKFKFFTILQ